MIVGPMEGPRNRSSIVLRVAATVALAIVLVVAVASSRWRTSATPTIEPPSIASTSDAIVPAPIEPVPETESRVAVRPSPPAAAAPAAPVAPPPRPASIPGMIQLVGEVRDPSGQRIFAMPAVLCYRTATRSLTNSIVRGEYVIGGLDPGVVGLECLVKGYRPESRHILLRRSETEQRQDFVLQPLWMVDVELRTPDGKDPTRKPEFELGSAFHFRISQDPPPETWVEDSAAARRASRLLYIQPVGPLKPGVFKRIAPLCDAPAYLSVDVAGHVLAANRLESGVERTTLVVPLDAMSALRSSFVCTVVDEGGSPIHGVQANLQRRGFSNSVRRISDETGRIRCGGLACGSWMLILKSEDRSTVIRFLGLQPGVETDLGTIVLDPSLHIRGHFVDDEGRALNARSAGLICEELSALPDPSVDPLGSDTWAWLTRIRTLDDGSFEGAGFGKARYLLESPYRPVPMHSANWMIRPTLVDCTGGSVDDLVVPMERVYLVTLRPEFDEAKDLGYSIVDASGSRIRRGDLADTRTVWLPAGDYRLLVGPDVGHTREIPFTVESTPVLIPVEP